MKIILTFLILLPTLVLAQLLPGGEKERYENSKDNSGGAGSLYSVYELKYLNLNGNTSIDACTRQGFLFDKFVVGANLNFRVTKTVEDPRYVDIRNVQSYFNFNHFGIFTDYIIPLNKKTMITVGSLFNLGYTSYELANTIGTISVGDYFVIIEPNINFSYKIYNNYQINLGASYRKTTALSKTAYPPDYFSGYGISLGVKVLN